MSETGNSPTRSGRLEFLDGLRGLAALVVVIDHFHLAVPWQAEPSGLIGGWLDDFPFACLTNGTFSVFVFFVLSGFVLAESSARGKDSLTIQLIARYLRLTVPMLVSLVFAWLLCQIFPQVRADWLRANPSEWINEKFYVSTLPGIGEPFKDGLYQVYLTGFSRLNNAVWTMHYEFIGSIGVYLFYRLVPLRGRTLAIAVALLLGACSPKYLGFPIGILMRELFVKGVITENSKAWIAFVVGILVYCEPSLSVIFKQNVSHTLAEKIENRALMLTGPIAAGLLVYAVLSLHVLRRFLSAKVPRFLGRISFALYLVHVPLIGSVIAWLLTNLTFSFYPKIGIAGLVLLATSIGTAWLMTVAIDEPLMNGLHALKKFGRGRRTSGSPKEVFFPRDLS